MSIRKTILSLFLICSIQSAFGKKPLINLSTSDPKVALINTSNLGLKRSVNVESKNFSGTFEVSRSSSLYDLKNGNKYDGMDYLVSIAYKLGLGTLSTGLSYTQNLNENDSENSTINDSHLKYSLESQSYEIDSIASDMDWGSSLSAIVPISNKSRDVDQLQTAVILSTNLTFIVSNKSALKGFGLGLGISAGQNFHSFETDKNGNFLNKNSSNQSISLIYSLKKIRFLFSYANKIRWAYQGDTRNSFEFSQDVTYSFLDSWSASAGHTNSGSSLKPNGIDSNLSVIDEDNSIVYVGLAYSF